MDNQKTSPINTGNGADTERSSSIVNVSPHVAVNKPGKTSAQGSDSTSLTSYHEHEGQYVDFSEQTGIKKG